MRTLIVLLVTLALLSTSPSAQAPTGKTLDIYVIDVEGGHATLYVSPSGQSMLVDAGYAGFEGRDAGRIAAAAKLAGVKQIDYLVVSHFHGDHIGGVPEVAALLPIRNFVDHGATSERGERQEALFKTYAQARSKGTHIEAQPGAEIPVAGLNVRVLTASGGLLSIPVEGGGIPNPLCANFKPMKDETSDDAHSVGTLVTFGKFRTVNLGDLSWNQEYGLVCPTNRIGTIDVLVASQHGDEEAGSPTFVHALRPKVAVTNNGVKKGVIQPIAETLRSSPGFQDLWQLHFSMLGNQQNGPPEFIANLGDVDTGHWLKVSAREDGSFTVTNGRTGVSKSYPAGS
jgi:beta-lactamase superfamily II metal-dependent hydrolase